MPEKMNPEKWRWGPYFRPEEFADPHGEADSGLFMSPDFMDRLYGLRELADSPIIINPNGGFASRGHAANSAHYEGLAADIRCEGMQIDVFSNYIRRLGFHGVGFYEHWRPCAGFHVDLAKRRARWVRTLAGRMVSLT